MHRIESDRLVLRELEAADCSEDYLAWLGDPEVYRYLETRHSPQNMDSVRGFVESVLCRDDEVLFGIFLKPSGRHIGNIKVGPIRPYHLVADVSLLVGARDCWGQGYAAEAIGLVSRFAFESLGVCKLSASMYAPNVGSKQAFLKSGYREEGVRRGHFRLSDERCDLIELGLVPEDLEAR